jgi:hypothetical protein
LGPNENPLFCGGELLEHACGTKVALELWWQVMAFGVEHQKIAANPIDQKGSSPLEDDVARVVHAREPEQQR